MGTTDNTGRSTPPHTIFIKVVANLPPTADANGPYEGDEGSPITIVASGSSDPDPGDVITYSVDCTDDGTFEAVDQAESTFDCTYGDNGSFTVRVRVKDSGGMTDEATAAVTVNNVVPNVTLDTSSAIAFAGGDAFLGRKNAEQSHEASATDPGADDLIFTWSLGQVNIYLNSGGVFPFSATDQVTGAFNTPGLSAVTVKVADDDGGAASDSLPKLVTDNQDCTRSKGFWRHQFGKDGDDGDEDDHGQQIDATALQGYLDIVNFASGVFSEKTAASTLAEARVVFNADDDDEDDGDTADKRAKATRQALAAWLNFASGAVGWDEVIAIKGDDDDDNDGPPVTLPFHELIAQVETILLNPDASHKDLVKAKNLSEAVNLLDEDNEACEDEDDEGGDSS